MNLLELPWVEAAILLAIVGWGTVSWIRPAPRTFRWGVIFAAASFACTLLAWLSFDLLGPAETSVRYSLQQYLLGKHYFKIDKLNAPLLPTVALLHFLMALSTAKANVRRFSISWSLAAEAIRLATFSCQEPWLLVGLLSVATVPPYIELKHRDRGTGVYLPHMALYVALLITGWATVDSSAIGSTQAHWGAALLMAAILVRCGTIPAHCWVIDWFEKASFGIAILYVVPLTGVYAAVRLVLPIAPEWTLRAIGLMSLATAVYAAAMATVQREARRFYAYLFLSHASLVLVGLELQQSDLSLTASLCLWFSVILSLGGFGLALRSLEARFGRLSLVNYHGLYGHSPTLAVCFLLTGLACVGFPATIGFISTELLVDGTVEVSPIVGIAVVAASALNGIAIVRAYLLIFTGTKHTSKASLDLRLRERMAVLTLAALILGGGLYPQPGVTSRHEAAEQLVERRRLATEAAKRQEPKIVLEASR